MFRYNNCNLISLGLIDFELHKQLYILLEHLVIRTNIFISQCAVNQIYISGHKFKSKQNEIYNKKTKPFINKIEILAIRLRLE
jgi:hypothetical protein